MVLCSVLVLLRLFCKLIMAENKERTFIMIKPDGVQRGLVGKIIQRFEDKGFKLVAMKMLWPNEDLLKKHYSDLASRPFFPGLIKYMSSGPVVPMVIAFYIIQLKNLTYVIVLITSYNCFSNMGRFKCSENWPCYVGRNKSKGFSTWNNSW
ncbi:Nucleoside diphosphate kinase [Melipona quadrifasciata]|uniref:nucleoside-diphosphate kinase n=1 Tax=Melipona quadrifasciata TaxID=166423 RepID=A0A0N0BJ05_9HYME|nr:Nucleoside diphosphate kinase [Melipona quadrifasciata]